MSRRPMPDAAAPCRATFGAAFGATSGARFGARFSAPVGARSGDHLGARRRAAALACALGATLWPATASATCFDAAGLRYGVSPLLLQAIARQESAMNPRALHRNDNGSTDLGLMQINSAWLPTLARHGVRERDLWDPCANVMVGAWILGGNFRAMGRNADALGAYNARDPQKRLAYARQVLRHYVALRAELSPPPARR